MNASAVVDAPAATSPSPWTLPLFIGGMSAYLLASVFVEGAAPYLGPALLPAAYSALTVVAAVGVTVVAPACGNVWVWATLGVFQQLLVQLPQALQRGRAMWSLVLVLVVNPALISAVVAAGSVVAALALRRSLDLRCVSWRDFRASFSLFKSAKTGAETVKKWIEFTVLLGAAVRILMAWMQP